MFRLKATFLHGDVFRQIGSFTFYSSGFERNKAYLMISNDGYIFFSLAHWLPAMLIQFLCIVWKLSFKAKQDDISGSSFLCLPPQFDWSVSCMKKQKPTFGAFVFQLIPCKCSPLSCCSPRSLWYSGVRKIDFDFQQIFLLCFLCSFPVEISSHALIINISRASYDNYESAKRCLGWFCVGVGYVAPVLG